MQTNLTFWKNNELAVISKEDGNIQQLANTPAYQSKISALVTALDQQHYQHGMTDKFRVFFDQPGWFNALTEDYYPDTIFYCVAWRQVDKKESMLHDPHRFYFCDDPETWDSPWLDSNLMTKWRIVFSKPLIIRTLPEGVLFEELVDAPEFNERLEEGRYDAVIYLGDGSGSVGRVRQGFLSFVDIEIPPMRILNFKIVLHISTLELSPDFDAEILKLWLFAAILRDMPVLEASRIVSLLGKSNSNALISLLRDQAENIKTQLIGFEEDEIIDCCNVVLHRDVGLLMIVFVNTRAFGVTDIPNIANVKDILPNGKKHKPFPKQIVDSIFTATKK